MTGHKGRTTVCKVAGSRGKERMILLVTPRENGKGEGSGKKSRMAPFSDHILIPTDPLEKLRKEGDCGPWFRLI